MSNYTIETEEEYLVQEPEREYKSEFRDGRVVAMAGASLAHAKISTNVFGELFGMLKGSRCNVFASDMRVKVAKARLYTYPDVTVVCGELELDRPKMGTVMNPTVIVEVLSPSTEDYDRGEKFEYYKKLDSLQEYVLISQNQARVECFRKRDEGHWEPTESTSLDTYLVLNSIDCKIPLADIYRNVTP